MHISRFQLKLTFIFLIVLLIPAIISTLLTRYVITVERTFMGEDVDKKVEAVLQDVSGIVYDIVEEAEIECQSIAEDISDDEKFISSFRLKENLENVLAEIAPIKSYLSVTILDFRTGLAGGKTLFSASEDDASIPYSIIERLKEKGIPLSAQEDDLVYGAAPVFDGNELMGAVIIHQRLKQELVKNITDLRRLLGIYALKPDLQKLVWAGLVAQVLVLAIIGAVLAATLARSVTKPILSLVEGTKEIAGGNLDHRVEAKGKDEVAVLVDSFNSMAGQLKASRDKLLVAERLAAWRDIARRIAHEIKNPLTPILLSMYRLRKNLGSEKYDQIFDQAYTSITNEVENLRNMVTEFSQFARMPKPRTHPSSASEIVQNAINLYTGLPDNIYVKTKLADNLPQVMADEDQMRQVLHNLIGNAVDAMADGGRLSVETRLEKGDFVAIEVSDTGCGMSDEVRKKIFTPYFTTKEKGTGLGMAITAQIIEEHGGEISVSSTEGVGTTVTVRLKAIDEKNLATDE